MNIDPTLAWRAVLNRDRSFDGHFVFGVFSTRIYCRPSCPARRPLRSRVTFFDTSEAAAHAGYRACRRCRPDQGSTDDRLRLARSAAAYLSAHPDAATTLAALGRRFGVSPFVLQRTFKKMMGLSPKEFAAARQRERLKTALRRAETVTDAIYEAGYGSSSRVYESAAAALGMTPAAYRNGGRGMRIRYVILRSRFGLVLVAATARGVCHVSIGDDRRRLEDRLRREYPNGEIEAASDDLAGWADAVIRCVDVPNQHSRVPLDVAGTPFQWKVWKALQRIPFGGTQSYRDVARHIGKPSAARAVARACATNRVSLVVPCHRVVRSDGGLGGYEWGVERKRKLLEHERAGGTDGASGTSGRAQRPVPPPMKPAGWS